MHNTFPMCMDWKHAGDCMARCLLPGISCVSQASCRGMYVNIEDKIWTWSATCIRHCMVQTCFQCDAQHLSYVHVLKTCGRLYDMITSSVVTALVSVISISEYDQPLELCCPVLEPDYIHISRLHLHMAQVIHLRGPSKWSLYISCTMCVWDV